MKRAATCCRAFGLVGVLVAGCSEKSPPPESPQAQEQAPSQSGLPRTARPKLRADLLADIAAVRHASDGGGRAWIEPLGGHSPEVVAGSSASWRIVFEAGELGVATGGAVFFQVSPFWGWSTPQVQRESDLGFTRVSTPAQGVELTPRTLDQQLLGVHIDGRALAAGERIVFDYGVGPLRAKADDFAEERSRFWIAVDGDGDGVRKLIAESPWVAVLPGPAELLSIVAPTVLRPAEVGRLHVALLDAKGNAGSRESASIRFHAAPPSLGLAETLQLDAAAGGSAIVDFSPTEEGTFHFTATATLADGRELQCAIGPLLVSSAGRRVLWADLHGHSGESDGSGTPEQYWRYGRDVAGLDFLALTDHDHWGMEFLDRRPDTWRSLVELARSFDAPGRFVALPGFEFTDWIHGHRCVIGFDDSAELLSSVDERSDSPQKLWDALRGKRVLTIPHHMAGGPIALDWNFAAEPELEPVIEIASVHGSSEAADSPGRIYSPVPGHFARDALERKLIAGFIASGDSHDGHPGLAHLAAPQKRAGLAAIVCEERTREALYDALRSRRVYGTTGARILLRFSFAGRPMGSIISAEELGLSRDIYVNAIGSAPIARIEVIHGAEVAIAIDGEGRLEAIVAGELKTVAVGDFVYVRVVQTDGHMAWSSPVFVR